MINLQVKYEDFVIYVCQDNQQKPSGLPTDQQTDRQRPTLETKKKYTLSSLKGGITIYIKFGQLHFIYFTVNLSDLKLYWTNIIQNC